MFRFQKSNGTYTIAGLGALAPSKFAKQLRMQVLWALDMKESPWARLLAYVTGLINQEPLLKYEYPAAENRILRAHLPARLRLSDAERAHARRDWSAPRAEGAGADACVAKQLAFGGGSYRLES